MAGGAPRDRQREPAGGRVDDGRRDHRDPGLIRGEEGGLAELVDDARNTPGVAGDSLDGVGLEHVVQAGSGQAEPVRHVRADLRGRQARELHAQRVDRAAAVSAQPREPQIELGLPDQQDGHPRSRRHRGVGERPELLQLRLAQMLRLVDGHDGGAVRPGPRPEDPHELLASHARRSRIRGVELPGEPAERLVQDGGEAAPEHAATRGFDVAGHPAQERRLPGPRLAREDDQAGKGFDGGEDLRARALVARTREEGIGVRGGPERVLTEAERRTGHR
jgi:hypothetical protein